MECKGLHYLSECFVFSIGIYPEWNVKFSSIDTVGSYPRIGIYPEWNVKMVKTVILCNIIRLEYIQNGM